MFNRIIMIVLDSAGVGALPDAPNYNDEKTNTLEHIATQYGHLQLPILEKWGLGNIPGLNSFPSLTNPLASVGRMAEISLGKDTTSGHWELMGCPVPHGFPLYPQGFPRQLIEKFSQRAQTSFLGNKPASGTEIIQELGEEHVRTGFPIIYTSADSVCQIAAHEEIIPLKKLYELCNLAREEIFIGEHAVGRIIARPFIGTKDHYVRTANRHDFSLEPVGETLLDILVKNQIPVHAVGKIGDIFAQRGITTSTPTHSNDEGMEILLQLVLKQEQPAFLFLNLVDFDMLYGHRRNVIGYAKALERFDAQLALLQSRLSSKDLLIISADHGCDPTHTGSDHTREYVPLLVWSPSCQGVSLGTRQTFADVAQTIADNFSLRTAFGTSFLSELKKR